MMVDKYVERGLPEPEFIEDSGVMSVVFLKDIYQKEYLENLGLNERQKKAVLFVKEKGRITNMEYQKLCSISERTALRDLESLTNLKLFMKIGEKKGTYYRLSHGG